MAQSTTVMAFRKRLKNRGYVAISIEWDTTQEVYLVGAFEPLAGQFVRTKMTENDMYSAMR